MLDRLVPTKSIALMSTVAVVLIVIVLVRGDWSDELNLASAIAGGLVVAVAVTFWEVSRHSETQRSQGENRRAMQRTLTTFAGAELSNIATAVNLTEVDDDGNSVEVFPDINDAVAAFSSPGSVNKVMVAVGQLANGNPDAGTTLNAWDSVERFYGRIAQQFSEMLQFFIAAGDDRLVDTFLDLWKLQRSHAIKSAFIWKLETQRNSVHDITDEAAPRASYLQTVVAILHAYGELLRAIEGLESGIPSKRNN